MSRLGGPVSFGHGQACLRCARVAHGGYRRPRSAPLAPCAALLDPPPFDPSKLRVEYLPGAREQPITTGRRYTLTHNDVTGSLQLAIGRVYNRRQLDGWYTRILRDEILAEWQDMPTPLQRTSSSTSTRSSSSSSYEDHREGSALPSLHVYCHVSGEELWPAPPRLRSFIFQREMALVLDTIAHAEADALAAAPQLQAAPVYVHLRSDVPALDRVVEWGVLGDRATWRTARSSMVRSLLSSVMGTLDEGDEEEAADGSAGTWSRAAFLDASLDASLGTWDGDADGAAPVAADALEPQPQEQRQQQSEAPVAQPAVAGRNAEDEPASSTGATGVATAAPVDSHPDKPLMVATAVADVVGPASSNGSTSSAAGIANGAVSLVPDGPSWLSGSATVARQRISAPAAAAEPVPVAVRSRSRHR